MEFLGRWFDSPARSRTGRAPTVGTLSGSSSVPATRSTAVMYVTAGIAKPGDGRIATFTRSKKLPGGSEPCPFNRGDGAGSSQRLGRHEEREGGVFRPYAVPGKHLQNGTAVLWLRVGEGLPPRTILDWIDSATRDRRGSASGWERRYGRDVVGGVGRRHATRADATRDVRRRQGAYEGIRRLPGRRGDSPTNDLTEP